MFNHLKKWLALKVCIILALLALLGAWAPLIGFELLEMSKDVSYSADVISYDDLYDAQSQQFTGKTQSKTTFSYKTVGTEENGDINIIEALFDVRTQDGEPIFSVKRYYGINHDTYMHASGYGDENREGYLFGPAGSSKADFTYWHINYDTPLTMVFQNEEDILGLNTYHYKSDFKADQTASLTNLEGVGKTKGINLDGTIDLWIEPMTGDLVKYGDSATAYYYDLATGARLVPWNQFSNQFSFDSVASHVAQAESDKTHVFVIKEAAPAILFALIAVFTAWCAIDVKKIWNLRASNLIMAINSAVIMISVIIISAWLINNSSGLITLFGATSETNIISAAFILVICLCNIFAAQAKSISRWLITVLHVLLGVIIAISLINIVCIIAGINFVLTYSGVGVTAATSFGVALLALACLMSLNDKQKSIKYTYAHDTFVALVLVQGAISIFVSSYQFIYAQTPSWYGPLNVSTAIFFMLIAAAEWNSSSARLRTILNKWPNIKPLALALMFVFFGVVATGFLWNYAKSSAYRTVNLRFANDIARIEGLIVHQLDSYTNALLGAKSLFSSSDNVTRSEWKSYVDGLNFNENFPGDQGLGYVAIIPAAQKQTFEQQIRAQGLSNYIVYPADPPRSTYAPIVYIEPLERNASALGLDIYSEPIRANAAELARDTGEAAMSGKVSLALTIPEDQRTGFVLFAPVYKKGTTNNTISQRQNNIQGFVTNPVRIGGLMQAAVGNQSNGVAIAVYDTSDEAQLNGSTLMYESSPGTDYADAEFTEVAQIANGGRTWTLRFASLPGYAPASSINASWFVLISGLGVSVLLGIAFFGLASSRQRAIGLARRITRDLEKEKDNAVHLQKKDDAILASIGEGLILYSPRGIIERTNAAALRMLGREESEVVGRQFTDALKATDDKKRIIPQNHRPSVLAVKKGMAISSKLFYMRKDGSCFPAEITIAPILSGGKAIGAIEVFRDITAEVALDQAKSDFISLASHQLRTPLTANKWYLESLLTGDVGKLKPKQLGIVKEINTSNERLIELVVSLLNVTRIESGRLAINPKPVRLRRLIDDVVANIMPKLKSKDQHLDIEVPTLPEIILDANMIRQVVLNLLTNAIKYSPKKTTITVKVERQDSHVICEVKDQGYGIPADQQKHMFEKFFRAKNVTQKEPDGNGLGLYLVKQIVEASGGKIWFTSVQDKGTSFYFTLPLKGVHAKKGEVTLEERASL